jgi:riboflavin biosynthesis pyrimidine reductase
MISRLLPDPGEFAPDDIADLIAAEERPTPSTRPWVVVNMVTSADGATAFGGVSGKLGSDVDSATFHALRSVADIVLAGSGTVTAERYRHATLPARTQQLRRERGQAPEPRIAVVSNRGDIDLELPLFAPSRTDPRATPIVFVAGGAVTEMRRAALAKVADVVEIGDQRVDMGAALEHLATHTGARTVVCEGGPTLNGLLVAEDLVDEWCLTVAPSLAGGSSQRSANGPDRAELASLDLSRVWLHEGELLLRYVRSTPTSV